MMTEAEAMARASQLAWRGWGRVHPNPLVGAVVLSGSEGVGEGYHADFGGPHAEPVALADAGDRARGATLVVTLEPCAHHGKQPPCTEAIIAAGIRRVVYAIPDPHPIARGGCEALRQAGVVTMEAPDAAVRAQLAMFLHACRDPARPFVALKLAVSLDARIADREGRSRWISGPDARAFVHWLRAGFDAIGVGGRTARIDNPALTVRGDVQPRLPPARVIFDRQGDLTGAEALLRSASEIPVHLVTAPGSGDLPRPEGVRVLPAEDLSGGLAMLRGTGVRSLLVEGGGRLATALLAANLVDRVYLVQAPCWLGEDGVPAFPGLAVPSLTEAERWHVVERRALGADSLLVLDRAA